MLTIKIVLLLTCVFHFSQSAVAVPQIKAASTFRMSDDCPKQCMKRRRDAKRVCQAIETCRVGRCTGQDEEGVEFSGFNCRIRPSPAASTSMSPTPSPSPVPSSGCAVRSERNAYGLEYSCFCSPVPVRLGGLLVSDLSTNPTGCIENCMQSSQALSDSCSLENPSTSIGDFLSGSSDVAGACCTACEGMNGERFCRSKSADPEPILPSSGFVSGSRKTGLGVEHYCIHAGGPNISQERVMFVGVNVQCYQDCVEGERMTELCEGETNGRILEEQMHTLFQECCTGCNAFHDSYRYFDQTPAGCYASDPSVLRI